MAIKPQGYQIGMPTTTHVVGTDSQQKLKVVIIKYNVHTEPAFLPIIEDFINQKIKIHFITSWGQDFYNYTQIIYEEVVEEPSPVEVS